MTVNLLSSTALTAALTGDGDYVQIIAPPAVVTAEAVDCFGLIGTASWGPVGTAVYCPNWPGFESQFGSITSAALGDVHDLPSAAYVAFGQGSPSAGLEAQVVRVTDGTDTPAQFSATFGVIKARYSGSLGNSISITLTNGSAPNTFNVTVTPPSVLGAAEQFVGLPAATFNSSLATALATGTLSRGPSRFMTLIPSAQATPLAPLANPTTLSLSGGSDGRAVTSANMLGSNAAFPFTGLYALQDVTPAPSEVNFVGLTDQSIAAAALAEALVSGYGIVFDLPTGNYTATTASAAITAAGISSPAWAWSGNWIYWFDPANQVTRFTAPGPFMVGMIATLGPQENPGNEQILLITATERSVAFGTGSLASGGGGIAQNEVGVLANAGILMVSLPIPQGQVWGLCHGQSTAPAGPTKGMEYWRMTNFLARSAASILGLFVDETQSIQPDDPLRKNLTAASNNFLASLGPGSVTGGSGVIDGYSVTCALSTAAGQAGGNGINTPTSIAAGFVYCLWQVRYLGIARFVILGLQGGNNVTVAVQSSIS